METAENIWTKNWKSLGPKDPRKLAEARIQLHYASQYPGAAGHSLLEHREDYSEGALDWSPEQNALLSAEIPAGDQVVRVGLGLADLELFILSGNTGSSANKSASLKLAGKTYQAGLDWLDAELQKLIPAHQKLITPIEHYKEKLPEHELGKGGVFATPDEDYETLANYFTNSRTIILSLARGEPASPFRIWWHHFDGASIFTYEGSGEESRSVNLGLSMGDGTYDRPYFYVSPWPYPAEKEELTEPGGGGFWHREGYTAAILPADTLQKQGDDQAQARAAGTFLSNSLDISKNIIGIN